jgi:hypothetical protein
METYIRRKVMTKLHAALSCVTVTAVLTLFGSNHSLLSATADMCANERHAKTENPVPQQDFQVSTGTSFVPNRGQWSAEVLYHADVGRAGLWFTRTAVVYDLDGGEIDSDEFGVSFPGSNSEVEANGENELHHQYNFIVGIDRSAWLTDIPSFGAIRYKDIYPHIDLTYVAGERGLEYDFIVAPGGDPNDIIVQYKGVNALTINDSGELVIETANGRVVEGAPVAYELDGNSHRPIDCEYILLAEHAFGFRFKTQRSMDLTLVIDPQLSFSSYLAGSGDDSPYGIAVDRAGDVYIAGSTESSNFPTQGAFDATANGGMDIFVTKISNSDTMNIIYSTYIGGSSDDRAYDIAVDSLGNAYVAGYTRSSNFPTVAALDATYGGGASSGDAFVLKLSPAGNSLSYSTYLGGSDNDQARAIDVTDDGAAFVVGYTSSSDFPVANAYDASYNGGTSYQGDAFVTKISPGGGSLAFSTFLGGSDNDEGFGIDVDTEGRVVIAGATKSSDFPTVNAYDGSYNGGGVWGDAFVARFSASGANLEYSTFLGGSSDEWGFGVAVGSDGNSYITGSTQSSDFPTTGTDDSLYNGTKDIFLARLDSTGLTLRNSACLGGSSSEDGIGVTLAGGSVYLTGTTSSTDFPIVNPIDSTLDGGSDVFVCEVDTTLWERRFATYIGGSGAPTETGRAIEKGIDGAIWITGFTSSTDFPRLGGFSYVGSSDGFVFRLIDTAGSACPDLVVSDFTLSGEQEVEPGEEIGTRLYAEIANIGTADHDTNTTIGFWLSFDTIYSSDDSLLPGGIENESGPLEAGNSLPVSIFSGMSVRSGWPEGPAYLLAVVDPYDQNAEECNETNNTFYIPVYVINRASFQEVADYVRDTLLGGTYDSVTIWMTDFPLDQTHIARDIDSTVSDLAFPYDRTWLVMIDEEPDANWGHPVKWVFVNDSLNVNSTPVVRQFIPTVISQYGSGMIKPILCRGVTPWPCISYELVPYPGTFTLGNPKDCLHAVLVSGGWNSGSNYSRYAQNLGSMYRNLRGCGIPKANIHVYYADGSIPLDLDNADADNDNSTGSDLDGGAVEADFRSVIQDICTNGDPARDVLLIYFSNHGADDMGAVLWDFNSNGYAGANEIYTPAELADDTRNSSLLRLFQIHDQCFSGEFVPMATDGDHDNAVVYSAATASEVSWGREYMDIWEDQDLSTDFMNDMHDAVVAAGITSTPLTAEGTADNGDYLLCECQTCINKTLIIRDADGTPVDSKAFSLFRVSNNPPDMTEEYLGEYTTNSQGEISICLELGDSIKVERKIVDVNSWKHWSYNPVYRYHLFVDNAVFDETTGNIWYEEVDAFPDQYIDLIHPTVVIDLAVSVQWDATSTYLNELSSNLRYMSNFLYDVFDGQARLGDIYIYDNGVHFNSVDIRIHASNMVWPHAFINGWDCFSILPEFGCQEAVNMPPKWFGSSDATRNGTRNEYPLDLDYHSDFSTKVHELGHYFFGFYDEYIDGNGNSVSHSPVHGFMEYQYLGGQPRGSENSRGTVEYASSSGRNTAQWAYNGLGTSEQFRYSFQATYGGIRVEFRAPEEYTALGYLQGPNDNPFLPNYDVGALANIQVANYNTGANDPLMSVRMIFCIGQPIPNIRVAVAKSSRSGYELGRTADDGLIRLRGINSGDQFITFGPYITSICNPARSMVSYNMVEDKGWIREAGQPVDSAGILLMDIEPIAGRLPMVQYLSSSGGALHYQVDVNRLITPVYTPTLEISVNDTSIVNSYGTTLDSMSFTTATSGPLGPSGWLTLQTLDTLSDPYNVYTTYKAYVLRDTMPDKPAYSFPGPEGMCELTLDSANGQERSVVLASTCYPPLTDGLGAGAVQAGETVSWSFLDSDGLMGNNILAIRYTESDLGDSAAAAELEPTLAIYRWIPDTAGAATPRQWTYVGGSVDTAFNAVRSVITEPGTYAAFATTEISFDTTLIYRIGTPVLTFFGNDSLRVGNLGTSGDDGVGLYLDSVPAVQVGVRHVDLAVSDAVFKVSAFGITSAATQPNTPAAPDATTVGGVVVTNVGSTIQITADFNPIGDPDILVQVFSGGMQTGEASIPGGGVVAIGKDAGAGLPEIVGVSLTATSPPTYTVEFDRMTRFELVGGPVLFGDEMRFVAENATSVIEELTELKVTAGSIGYFTLTEITSGCCCLGFTGNVDGDPVDIVDIGDLTALISYLYIPPNPVPVCSEEANVDGDAQCLIDIGDLTALISYLYIPPNPVPSTCTCQCP